MVLRLRACYEDGNFGSMPTEKVTEFPNVTAVAKANVYFDGKVVSHTLRFADGSKRTLGLIYAGEYHFGTDAPERMDIIAGSCEVKLDGSEDYQAYTAGASFRVPGKSGFTIAVAGGIAEYVCSFE
jgi:purine/pyrimidine-nucleoside phosphorylase